MKIKIKRKYLLLCIFEILYSLYILTKSDIYNNLSDFSYSNDYYMYVTYGLIFVAIVMYDSRNILSNKLYYLTFLFFIILTLIPSSNKSTSFLYNLHLCIAYSSSIMLFYITFYKIHLLKFINKNIYFCILFLMIFSIFIFTYLWSSDGAIKLLEEIILFITIIIVNLIYYIFVHVK